MDLSPGVLILLVIAALVVWAIVSGKIDTKNIVKEVQTAIDNRKPSTSATPAASVTIDHAAVIETALQGAASVVQAAVPVAPPTPPAPPAQGTMEWWLALPPSTRVYYPMPGSQVATTLQQRVDEAAANPGKAPVIGPWPGKWVNDGVRRYVTMQGNQHYSIAVSFPDAGASQGVVFCSMADDPAGQQATYFARLLSMVDGSVVFEFGGGIHVAPFYWGVGHGGPQIAAGAYVLECWADRLTNASIDFVV